QSSRGVGRRSSDHDGVHAQRRSSAFRSRNGCCLGGPRRRRDCSDRRNSGALSGTQSSPAGVDFVTGPNLSEWALKHRSFTIFLMLVVTVAGLTSYFRLGRNEDPAFTFRTMVVQAAWPGATLDDTLSQVTERLERKLQEIKGLDFLRSYTTP